MEKYDSTIDTFEHKKKVSEFMNSAINGLSIRSAQHDNTKLTSPEKEIFDKFTPLLKNSTYGSDEYNQFLKDMKIGLDHHYGHNRHHPEHFSYYECNGCFKHFQTENQNCDVCGYSQFQKRCDFSGMNLLDLVEMICDWKAASERHKDGDVLKSIEIGQKKFGYSDELKQILFNTINIIYKITV